MSRFHGVSAAVATLVLAALAGTGCFHHHPRSESVHAHRGGPPSHAPAHGYRHQHRAHGPELAFDSELGLYIVIGHADHYFHEGRYYKRANGRWYVSLDLQRGWASVGIEGLPPVLHKTAKKRGKKSRRHGHVEKRR